MSLARLDTLRLVHHHPGRLRLRADGFRTEQGLLARLRESLSGLSPVQRVTGNEETGSLLIEYEPGGIEPDQLVALAAKAGGFERVVDETIVHADPEDPVRHLVHAARELNKIVGEATDGMADLRLLVPLGLFSAGVYSLVKQPRLPRWENLFVWSFQFFVSLNERACRGESSR